jgi:hypothetical protein
MEKADNVCFLEIFFKENCMGMIGNVASRTAKRIGRFLWLYRGGKIGVIIGVVFGIIAGVSGGNIGNIILFAPVFAILFGAIGALVGFVIGHKKQIDKNK